ncbi:MAG: aminotransferase class IV, partial [Mariprofundaceae bacterium]|nr:aminotransferase class IV [Mariprofundaceae bacterium]
ISTFSRPDGYMRLVLTRGKGPLGIDPGRCGRPTMFILADKLSVFDDGKRADGADLIIASTRRLSPDSLDPRIKSLNYLNHILARIEANAAGADEAVLLNGEGRIAEGTADNVFIVRNDVLQTPPCTDGALAGVTRNVVMELAEELGIPCRKCSLAPYDLHTADACFLSGTGTELMPVSSVDGRRMKQCPGRVFEAIEQAFRTLIRRECSK